MNIFFYEEKADAASLTDLVDFGRLASQWSRDKAVQYKYSFRNKRIEYGIDLANNTNTENTGVLDNKLSRQPHSFKYDVVVAELRVNLNQFGGLHTSF